MRLGILGGGQLGRMLALAAHPLGVRPTVLDPAAEACAGHVCPHVRGEFDDYRALYELAQASDVVTYEFENVPVETARWLAERVPVYPPPRALEVSQDRVAEKTFLNSLGVPTPPFAAVETRDEFDAAVKAIGLPAVLKTRRFGYDGKGQAVIRTAADAERAWETLGGRPLILEGFVPFDRELSLLAVRGRDGSIGTYPLVENEHRDGILHRSVAPAGDLGEELGERAAEYAARMPVKIPPDTSRLVKSPMPGLIVSVAVAAGQEVKIGQELLILEAMKMENVLRAERDGTVAEIHIDARDTVSADQVLLTFA